MKIKLKIILDFLHNIARAEIRGFFSFGKEAENGRTGNTVRTFFADADKREKDRISAVIGCARGLLFLLSLSFVFALAYIGFIAVKDGAQYYLIAVPKVSGGGIPIEKLDEVNDSKFMLTYENLYDKSVKALQSNFDAVLKGTNESYPFVMNYSLTNGGFFTKDALNNNNNTAVLNEKAAFDMFGTLDAAGGEIQIDTVPYIVAGVINDSDVDNMNIFIPATRFSESAETIMTNLSLNNGMTEEYVKNELKHIGINDMKYDFINLAVITKSIKDNTVVTLEIILLCVLLISAKKTVKSAYGVWRELRKQCKKYYFIELLKNESKAVQKLILLLIAATVTAIAGFSAILNIFERFLRWFSIRGVFSGVYYTSFVMNIAKTERLYFLSNTLFAGFFIVFIIFIASVWD